MDQTDTKAYLDRIVVGDILRFQEEKQRYIVQARGLRYIICTKPFNARHTVLYTIIDLDRMERGTENLTFGMGAETQEACENMLARLECRDQDMGYPTEISYKNCVPVRLRGAKK